MAPEVKLHPDPTVSSPEKRLVPAVLGSVMLEVPLSVVVDNAEKFPVAMLTLADPLRLTAPFTVVAPVELEKFPEAVYKPMVRGAAPPLRVPELFMLPFIASVPVAAMCVRVALLATVTSPLTVFIPVAATVKVLLAGTVKFWN